MASELMTQATFLLCGLIFGRLFSYRRGDARHRLGMSCLAILVMGFAGTTMIFILKGWLKVPAVAWPMVGMLAVFAWAVVRAGGNVAVVIRPEAGPSWPAVERRKVSAGYQPRAVDGAVRRPPRKP
ncbi:phage holin family protein [Pseudomonas kuykendallii]|uniref:phage holin family protein n=1 Tax=Pseudomonas kuykendallii TaxID=1007099 RepID=UPI0028D477DA|nr:phage holin family protein [Pseudomonas kuykendallii]